jgi:hypothetical protein
LVIHYPHPDLTIPVCQRIFGHAKSDSRRSGVAKRGRPPGGEYPDKKEVANFRIRPDTKRLLAAAARKSGRTVSQETEHQLRRALVDKGGPTHAVLGAISLAIDNLLTGTPTAEQWLKDPKAFDQVARAFATSLELFRPFVTLGVCELSIDLVPAISSEQLVKNLAQVTELQAPLGKQSVRERALAFLQRDLGTLLMSRPTTHEFIRTWLEGSSIGSKARCPLCNSLLSEGGTATNRTGDLDLHAFTEAQEKEKS